MSLKSMDNKGRWRNKTVAFRISPGEDEQLEIAVRLSGLTKSNPFPSPSMPSPYSSRKSASKTCTSASRPTAA